MKTGAKGLESSALASMKQLGVTLEEIPDWNCCGVVHSLCEDDLIHHVAPVRNLIRARQQGSDTLVTICAMCYNTLARANLMMRTNPEKRDKLNRFMQEEPDYHGEVEVNHLLTFLAREVGQEKIQSKVKVPLSDLSISPYYGCMLTRPREIAIESRRKFSLLTDLLQSLGATVKYFPAADRCCSSYQSVNDPRIAEEATEFILKTATNVGVEALAVCCPLCEFNLKYQQKVLLKRGRLHTPVPIYYFSHVVAVSFGLNPDLNLFEMDDAAIDLLTRKGFKKDTKIVKKGDEAS